MPFLLIDGSAIWEMGNLATHQVLAEGPIRRWISQSLETRSIHSSKNPQPGHNLILEVNCLTNLSHL